MKLHCNIPGLTTLVKECLVREEILKKAHHFNLMYTGFPQEKVTECGMIPTRPECSLLQQVGAQDFSSSVTTEKCAVTPHELLTPSKSSITKSSEDTESGASATPKEASRSFALDRRWITIHTVCLDLLNSPEVWDMKQMQVSQPFSTLSGDRTVENPTDSRHIKLLSGCGDSEVDNSYAGPTSTIGDHINREGTVSSDTSSLNNSDSMCNSIGQIDTRNAVACCREDSCSVSEYTQADSTECHGETMKYTNPSPVDDDQENKTPSINLGNLLENIKGGRSPSRRRYSSQFVVRHDLLRGQQKQLGTPMRGRSTMSSHSKDTRASILSEDHHSVQIFEKSQKITQQDIIATQISLSPDCFLSRSDSVGLGSRQEDSNLGINEKIDTIISCKEALIRLHFASKNALEQFSKLDSLVPKGNILTGSEADLYDEAAEMLPSIAKRVHTIAKLAQSAQNNTCMESGIDVPSFEPFLGTFAENISQRVVEILKKNAVTLGNAYLQLM